MSEPPASQHSSPLSPSPLNSWGPTHIHKLHVELLVKIFDIIRLEALEDDTEHTVGWALPLVLACKHWNEVVMNTPLLWQILRVVESTSGQKFAAWVARSGQVPLYVDVAHHIHTLAHLDILRVLVDSGALKRLKRLALHWKPRLRGPVCYFLEHFLDEARKLEHLCILETDYSPLSEDEAIGDISFQLFRPGLLTLPHLPMLQALGLANISVQFTTETNELKSLRIMQDNPSPYWSPSHSGWLLTLLQQCPKLRNIRLYYDCYVTGLAGGSNKISLRDLETFDVIAPCEPHRQNISRLLSNLVLGPNASYCVYTGPDDVDDPVLLSDVFPQYGTAERKRFDVVTSSLKLYPSQYKFWIRGSEHPDCRRLDDFCPGIWTIAYGMDPFYNQIPTDHPYLSPDSFFPHLASNSLNELPSLVVPGNIVALSIHLDVRMIGGESKAEGWSQFFSSFSNLRTMLIGGRQTAELYLRLLPAMASSVRNLQQLEFCVDNEEFMATLGQSCLEDERMEVAKDKTGLKVVVNIGPAVRGAPRELVKTAMLKNWGSVDVMRDWCEVCHNRFRNSTLRD